MGFRIRDGLHAVENAQDLRKNFFPCPLFASPHRSHDGLGLPPSLFRPRRHHGTTFAKTGVLYPFFGTLLGWLGVALTGSDTSSNVLFGSLQKISAQQIG